MTKITRYSPVFCRGCGYMTDAAACADDPDAEPSVGDLSFCLNCGHPAIYDRNLHLRELTLEDYRALEPEQWDWLAKAKRACSRSNGVDLTKQQRRHLRAV